MKRRRTTAVSRSRTAKRRSTAALDIEVIVQSRRWRRWPRAAAIVRRAIAAAAGAASTRRAGLAIVLGDDSAIRALNWQWRGLDAPTNVLSFPAPGMEKAARPRESGDPASPPSRRSRASLHSRLRGNERTGRPGANRREAQAHLGDIVIACETVAREAKAEDKPFMHHLAHLAVHGFLHLVGYDHDTDRKASRMERLEAEILATLRIPDPYARHVRD